MATLNDWLTQTPCDEYETALYATEDTYCTGELFIFEHPCGLWLLQHTGDDCTEQHAEYETLEEALEVNPGITRIDRLPDC